MGVDQLGPNHKICEMFGAKKTYKTYGKFQNELVINAKLIVCITSLSYDLLWIDIGGGFVKY